MFLGIGQIIGPMFGASVSAWVGFKTCCDIVGMICLLYSMLYYISADGQRAIKNSKWRNLQQTEEEFIAYPKLGMGGIQTPISNSHSISSSGRALMSKAFQFKTRGVEHSMDYDDSEFFQYQDDGLSSDNLSHQRGMKSERSFLSSARFRMSKKKALDP
mmetsp:Transcript_33466/g.51392  ORF Transcript_33466/g.51392 Transcript_33466/m.51392 type:complete len:159 (+) Transcript_33466:508-984(+)